MYCNKCGALNPDEAKFCRNCGYELKSEEKEEPKKVVVENEHTYQQSTNNTQTSSSKSDSSDWIGCCVCLIGIFILFALFGH